MHDEARRADEAEQDEAQRDHVARELCQHEAEEIQRHHGIELALAMQPRAESEGHFHGAQFAPGGGDDVEQDLEALRRKLRRELLEAVAADRKETAHGIGNLDAQRPLGDAGSKGADAGALLVETLGAAALDVAATDHELGLAALQ